MQKVFTFPPSQEFMNPPQLVPHLRDLRLLFDRETDTGAYEVLEVRFKDYLAYKVTVWGACEQWMVQAYDTLMCSEDSSWLRLLRECYGRSNFDQAFDFKHYFVYFDEFGCVEIVARSVEGMPTDESRD